MQMRKGEVHPVLFPEHGCVHRKWTKAISTKALKLINDFSKIPKCKVSTTSVTSVCTSKEKLENEIV